MLYRTNHPEFFSNQSLKINYMNSCVKNLLHLAVHPALRWPDVKFHRVYPVGSFDADCVQGVVSQGLDHRPELLLPGPGDLNPQAFLLSKSLQEGLAVHRWINQAGLKPACYSFHRRCFVDPGPLYGRLGSRPPQFHALLAAVNAVCVAVLDREDGICHEFPIADPRPW